MKYFFMAVLLISNIILAQNNLQQNLNIMLDNWHKAASNADFDTYFGMMSDDAVFLGTDAKERWSKIEFIKWAKPYFERESAWTLTPVERNIMISDNKDFAWFDETLETGMGPARGSGVLLKENADWKIVHYNLSLTIPNEIIPEVKKLVEEEIYK